MRLIYIALFGLIGVFLRHVLGQQIGKLFPMPFPVGTLTINLLGAFLIGIVFVLGAERALISEDLRIGLTVGFLGGFTTFSSYCFESALLIEKGLYPSALAYFAASHFFGLVACFFGMFIARSI